jgi:hypothetical protein
MPSSGRGGSAAAEDSILPMTLVQLEYPSQHEAVALETLYQTAAQTPWVVRLGESPNVPQATDLETALQHGQGGRWTRGLLVQVRLLVFCPNSRRFQRERRTECGMYMCF